MLKKLREFLLHHQVNSAISHLWPLLFMNVILSLVPFVVSAPVPVTLAFGLIAGLSIIFHLAQLRIYTFVGFLMALLVSASLKSTVPGGTFSGEFYSVVFSAVTLFKTFNVRKYGDGVVLLILTLATNASVLLMSTNSSWLVSMWSFSVALWTIVNLLRLNLRDLSSVALIASLRSALMGAIYTLPLLVFLFYFFQKFSHMTLYSRGESNISGISQIMEPGNVETLTKNSAVAFRALMDRKEFPFSTLYWKGPTLSHSKGMKWTKGQEGGLESSPRMSVASSDPCAVMQTIYLQGGDLSSYHIALDASIPSTYSPLPGNAYQITSKICNESRVIKSEADAHQRYLEVEADVSPAVKSLVRELGAGTKTSLEFASHLYKYYKKNKFKYSLNPPPLSPLHQLDDFMFAKRVGFCEHFAASFATLARLAGYPSRIVTGFEGGKYNRFGDYWLVSYKDAHAWVELWDEERGWIQVDPTAIVAPDRINNGASDWLSQAQPWWEKIEDNSVWQAGDAFFFWVRGLFDHRETLISLDDLTLSNGQTFVLVLMLCVFLLDRRLQRDYESAAQDQFKKLCRLLDEKAIPRGRSEGFDHYRSRLIQWLENDRRLRALSSKLDRIFSETIRIKYGSKIPPRASLRALYYEIKSAQRSIRIKNNFVVRISNAIFRN